MERLYNEAFSVRNKNKEKEDKIGTVTQQHIEENREILKDMQEEARNETYEPTCDGLSGDVISFARV